MACQIFLNVFNDSAFVCSYLCLSKKCFGEKPNGKAKPKTENRRSIIGDQYFAFGA
jgi:hypothetical protein